MQKVKVNIFNLGSDHYCQVIDSVGWIGNHLRLNPELHFTGGARGWVGDNPFIFLDTSKIRALGWKPKLTIKEGVEAHDRLAYAESVGSGREALIGFVQSNEPSKSLLRLSVHIPYASQELPCCVFWINLDAPQRQL